jgi:uncharacterized protein (TIGR02246 family)
MIRKCFSILLPLILLGLACQSTETEQPATTSTTADVEALKALVSKYDTAVNSNNLNDVMAFYVDDAVQMPPDEPIVIGKAAIRSRGEPFYEINTDQLGSKVEDFQVSGDWAFLRISYTESWTPKEGGDTTTAVGQWVIILQRQADSSWKITTEIWNRDAPLEHK